MRPAELWAAYEKVFPTGDRAAIRQFVADDVVAIDHRPLGFGEIHGAEAFLDYAIGFLEVAPGTTLRLGELLGESERGFAGVMEMRGGGPDAPIGYDFILLFEMRDEKGVRVWYYPSDAREDALRTLAAL